MTKWVDFKTVREHLNFHDVLAHYGIDEHGNGDQIKIICPFHNDHKPSCGVNLEKQVYNCFACDAGGNALDFVAHMEGLDPNKTSELRKAALAAADTFGIDQALERPANSRAKAKEKTNGSAKPAKAKAEHFGMSVVENGFNMATAVAVGPKAVTTTASAVGKVTTAVRTG